jgi:uncharacterized protein YqgV (UPF0045/DUF77 family)
VETSQEAKAAVLAEAALNEPLDSLSIELRRISAEIQSINSGFQAQMQQLLAVVRASMEREYESRLQKSLSEIREQIRIETQKELDQKFQDVKREIGRVTVQIQEIAKKIAVMLDDPSVPLTKVIHKRTEQSLLKTYLEGLQFCIGNEAQATAARAKL